MQGRGGEGSHSKPQAQVLLQISKLESVILRPTVNSAPQGVSTSCKMGLCLSFLKVVVFFFQDLSIY